MPRAASAGSGAGPGSAAPTRLAAPAVEAPASQFFLATPADWVQLDVSEHGPEAARRLIEGLPTGPGPGDPKLRAQVVGTLQAAIRQARQQGAVMAAFWFLPIDTAVLGASVTVAFAPLGPAKLMTRLTPEARAQAAAALGDRLGTADDVLSSDVVELPAAGFAARIRRRKSVAAMGEERDALVVQYYVPVPRRPRMLVITYATPTVELADALSDLFDSLAGSLRWRS